jgi:hypothetical protein
MLRAELQISEIVSMCLLFWLAFQYFGVEYNWSKTRKSKNAQYNGQRTKIHNKLICWRSFMSYKCYAIPNAWFVDQIASTFLKF